MILLTEIPGVDGELSKSIQLVLQALAEAWALELRRRAERGAPLPPLYRSGVVYRPEPETQRCEDWAPPPVVLERGWGDCDDLVMWRLAELLAAGERAHVQVARRLDETDPRRVRGTGAYHVLVRRESGAVEDPSKLLGG